MIIIVNKKHSIFNTFRVINKIKHFFEAFLVEEKNAKKFCQIY